MHGRRMVDVTCFDFSKASLATSHCTLTVKFLSCELDKCTIKREKIVWTVVDLKEQ